MKLNKKNLVNDAEKDKEAVAALSNLVETTLNSLKDTTEGKLKDTLSKLTTGLDLHKEYQRHRAILHKAYFDGLIQAGFAPEQAMFLVVQKGL